MRLPVAVLALRIIQATSHGKPEADYRARIGVQCLSVVIQELPQTRNLRSPVLKTSVPVLSGFLSKCLAPLCYA